MVAMNVWPTDAADGAVASEARWRKMGRLWAPSGVAAGQGGELAPSLAYPNLTVRNGACWIDGHYAELVGDQVLTVTANGLTVVRYDPAANTAELLYRDGATTPTQNPDGTWELPIAAISGSAMTDRRGTLINPAAAADAIMQRRGVSVSQSGQSVAASSIADMTWSSESYDTDNYFTVGGAQFVIPANLAGVYAMSTDIFVNAVVAGACAIQLWIDSYERWSIIPAGQQRGLLSTVNTVQAGQIVKVRILNGHNAAAFFSGSFELVRVAI